MSIEMLNLTIISVINKLFVPLSRLKVNRDIK